MINRIRMYKKKLKIVTILVCLFLMFFYQNFIFSLEKIDSEKLLDIVLFAPADNFYTTVNYVIFNGQVKNAVQLLINNENVKYDSSGKFSERKQLSIPNDYNFFSITAKSNA